MRTETEKQGSIFTTMQGYKQKKKLSLNNNNSRRKYGKQHLLLPLNNQFHSRENIGFFRKATVVMKGLNREGCRESIR